MPDNHVLTPEAKVQITASRMMAWIGAIAVAVAAAAAGYFRLEGRVSASEKDLTLRAPATQVDQLSVRMDQAATKADLERLGNEMREAFMSARWLCVRTRDGMECMTRVRHR